MKFFAIILITAIVSCNNKIPVPTNAFSVILPDTSMADLGNWEYKMSIDFCNQLNLPPLYKGVDSLEMRWWVAGYLTFTQIYDFRYDSTFGWLASKTDYFIGKKHDGQMNKYKIDSSITRNIYPKLDISKIADSIKAFDILHIPSQSNIPNFRDNVGDGTSVVIEIATKNYYKIISYHCPDAEAYKNEPNNQKMLRFYKFLGKQFGGPFLCFPSSLQ